MDPKKARERVRKRENARGIRMMRMCPVVRGKSSV